mmetsp:Transcript_27220/g.58335  ORF Transcript_27220/g.58335 Transcript_27220/m.58335 type:complete len:130 (-) Transcript_27220:955-1344(-)
MADVIERLQDLPVGFPTPIAIEILVSGLSEGEVRQLLFAEDACYPPSKIDGWIAELRSKGWFPGSSADNDEALVTAFDTLSTKSELETDGATYLWKELMCELTHDETDFKHRVAVLDNLMKQKRGRWAY